jgi:CheY-like chemotaxis protein
VVQVDDEIAIREAMTQLLGGWGYRVIAAGSAAEAVERTSELPVCPDLLICDYRLRGGENGIDAIARLRMEYNATIPALLITGDTAPERLAEAAQSGLMLLHKPVPNARLRAALAELLATPAPAGEG